MTADDDIFQPNASKIRFNHESSKSLTKDVSWVRLEDLTDAKNSPKIMFTNQLSPNESNRNMMRDSMMSNFS